MDGYRIPLMPGCELLPFDTVAGKCRACGTDLPAVRSSWCGSLCRYLYERNHYWSIARHAAIIRDGGCLRCGWKDDQPDCTMHGQYYLWSRAVLTGKSPGNWLEVNHITPRNGAGYGTGCHHNQENLETLCHRHHVKVTRRQRLDRVRAAR